MYEERKTVTLQTWLVQVGHLKASGLKLKKRKLDALTVTLYARMSSSNQIVGKE